MIKSAKYSIAFKTGLLCTALFAMVLWCGGNNVCSSSFRQFSMVTVGLIAVYELFAIIAHTDKGLAVWFPSFKFAVTISAVLTCAVAHFMLPGYFSVLSETRALALHLAHTILPAGMVLDWLLFDPHGVLRLVDPFTALIPAALYILAVWYGDMIQLDLGIPYWFLDRTQLGTPTAWMIVLGLGGGMVIVGYIFYVLDHLLAHSGKRK